MKAIGQRAVVVVSLVAASLFVYLAAAGLAQAPRTIVDEWAAVVPPPAPTLRAVTVDPKTTARIRSNARRRLLRARGFLGVL
jgi:hypothetical protein